MENGVLVFYSFSHFFRVLHKGNANTPMFTQSRFRGDREELVRSQKTYLHRNRRRFPETPEAPMANASLQIPRSHR
jgi:hypothetical protein